MAGERGITLLHHVLLSTTAPPHQGGSQQAVRLVQKVMSWNIHGSSRKGMAEARNVIVPRVIKKINPDIALLQETKTNKLVNRVVEAAKPLQRCYETVCAGNRGETRILYDADLYTPTPLDTQLRDVVSRVVTENQTSEIYKDRTSIVGLEHEAVRGKSPNGGAAPIPNILIFTSFHNTKRRKDTTSAFCKLVVELGGALERLVMAGADLNCSKDKIETHRAVIPAYVPSKRRRHKPIIDYIVLSGSGRRMEVSVVDWVDAYDDEESEFHEIVRDTVRESKYSLSDYSCALDHDPLVCKFTVTVHIHNS